MDQLKKLLHQLWQEQHKTTLFFDPVFLSVCLLLLSLLYLLKRAKAEGLNLLPSPPKLPIIGNLHQLRNPPYQSLRDLSAKYGPLMLLHFGQAPTVVVSSAKVAEEIIKDHDVAFSSRTQTRATDVLFFGSMDVAFCPYGEYWRQAKKICVLELLSQKRVQAFKSVREEEVAKMVEEVRASCINGDVIDLSDMFLTVSNNIVSRSALGRVYQKGSGDKSFGELSRITIYLRVIEEHQVSNRDDKSDARDIVDILLRLQKDGGLDIDLTRDSLKAILLDMFVGGTDTTAAAMEWAMSEIVKNPRVMEKAQEEVRRVARKKTQLSESDLNEMVYLKWVLKESLRLHAPAVIVRESTAAVKLEGYDIPPKTRVMINAWAIQRDPEAWDRPEEFIPERFADSSVDFKGQDTRFIPFGGGRRLCPGLSFAIVEAELVLANLLYWFNWELPNGDPADSLDLTEASTFIVHRKTPLLLVPVMHRS